MSEERFVDFESRLAFQEHRIQQLEDELSGARKQLYELDNLCRVLARKVSALPATTTVALVDGEQKPPHY